MAARLGIDCREDQREYGRVPQNRDPQGQDTMTFKFATIAAAVVAVAHIPQYASAVLADVAGRI